MASQAMVYIELISLIFSRAGVMEAERNWEKKAEPLELPAVCHFKLKSQMEVTTE